MSDQKIRSVQKGSGENDIYFTTDSSITKRQGVFRVEEIREERKRVSKDLEFTVYRGYMRGQILFEMGANIDVTVVYWLENKELLELNKE